MSILNLDPYLKADLKDRIYRVGVELEGGWEKLPAGAALTRDGSITLKPIITVPLQQTTLINGVLTAPNVGKNIQLAVGELVSEPMESKTAIKWVRQFYPSHVNDSCGLHVHFSFKSALHYQRLMVPDYMETIVAYFSKWAQKKKFDAEHPIWNRLAGRNRYCLHQFRADAQVTKKHKDYSHERDDSRYTAINYGWACQDRGTMECRLLPMLDKADDGVEAVQLLINITNASLLALGGKEAREVAEVTVAPKEYVREHLEEVV